MRDEYLELFIDNMGEATSRREVPASSIDKYRGVLPDRLLAYWQQEGWAGYAGGRFWTVDPDEYTPLLREWIKRSELADIDDYHVIGRTGFGTFYLWGQRYHRKVTVSCADNWVLAMKDEAQTPNPDPDRSLGVFFALAEPDDFDFEDNEEKPSFRACSANARAAQRIRDVRVRASAGCGWSSADREPSKNGHECSSDDFASA